ncbi:hypothetical protein ACFXJO_05600 [Streptomyces lavendulae]|uniref:hypothetical protein n=1 Tax=Streptomyces lavendulae TaxID=1914 RepID=UPI0036A796F1
MPAYATIRTIGGSEVEITSRTSAGPLIATCRGCTARQEIGSVFGRAAQYIDKARTWAQDHALNCWATSPRR